MQKRFISLLLLAFLALSIFSSSVVLAESGSDKDDDLETDDSDYSKDDFDDMEDDLDGDKDDEIEDELEDDLDNEKRVRTELREDSSGRGSGDEVKEEMRIRDNGEVEYKKEVKKRIVGEDGRIRYMDVKIEIKEKDGKKVTKLKIEDEGNETSEVETELEIEEETEGNETKIKARLSNGNQETIKVMPSTASERAIEVLGSKNLSIELREMVHNNVPRVVYHVESNKTGRFLGIFKMDVKIEGEIDAETGDVLDTSKPWWAFLLFGEDSDQTGEDEDEDDGQDNESETEEDENSNETVENDDNSTLNQTS